MILRVRRNFFEITTFPNSLQNLLGFLGYFAVDSDCLSGAIGLLWTNEV